MKEIIIKEHEKNDKVILEFDEGKILKEFAKAEKEKHFWECEEEGDPVVELLIILEKEILEEAKRWN